MCNFARLIPKYLQQAQTVNDEVPMRLKCIGLDLLPIIIAGFLRRISSTKSVIITT